MLPFKLICHFAPSYPGEVTMQTMTLTRTLKEIEDKAVKYTPKVGWQRSGLESFNFYLRFLNSQGILKAQMVSGNLS